MPGQLLAGGLIAIPVEFLLIGDHDHVPARAGSIQRNGYLPSGIRHAERIQNVAGLDVGVIRDFVKNELEHVIREAPITGYGTAEIAA